MALRGELELRPDCAIFADTGWEPPAVYDHLDWLLEVCDAHSFEVHIVTAGNLREHVLAGIRGERFASIPLHVSNRKGQPAMLRRQCTREFKIAPIQQHIRALLGLEKGERSRVIIEQWFGISLDEMGRIRRNRLRWVVNRYPLIEQRMTRLDCSRWLERHGYPIPPKSSCIGCPYHSDAYWRALQESDPEAWAEAITFDEAIRTGLRGVKASEAFIHRQLIPLADVDLLTEEDLGQQTLFDEGMLSECDGFCGV